MVLALVEGARENWNWCSVSMSTSTSRTMKIKKVFPGFTCVMKLGVLGLSVAPSHQLLESG